MVDITDFKDNRKPFVTITDVINSKTRLAKIVDESFIKDFKTVSGSTFKKLVVPIVLDDKAFVLSLFPVESDKIEAAYGPETKLWLHKDIELTVSGGAKPSVSVKIPGKG